MRSRPSIYSQEQLPVIHRACQSQGIGGELLRSGWRESIRRGIFRLLRLAKGFRRAGQAASIRRVLIFQNERIGDFILTMPLYAWLQEQYPGIHIDAICSTANADLVRHSGLANRTIAVKSNRGLHKDLWRMIGFLRSDVYDAIYVPTFTSRTRNAVLITLAKGSPRTATFSDASRSVRYGAFFDAVHIRRRPFEHVSHSVSMIGPMLAGVDRQPQLPRFRDSTARWKGQPAGPYVVIAIESAASGRSWSQQEAWLCARHIASHQPGVHVVLIDPLRAPYPAVEQAGPFSVWSGRIEELTTVVGSAVVVIAANSMAVHLAAALGTPVVGLYDSMVNAAEWYPLGVPYRIIMPASGSTVSEIDGEVVASAALEVFKEHGSCE